MEFSLRTQACARLCGYHLHADRLSAVEYVHEVLAGHLSDPTLSFQLKQDFRPLAVAPDYLLHDPESLGFAAVIEWFNPEVATAETSSFSSSSRAGMTEKFSPADPQLLARCSAGEAAAWDDLFDRYYAVVARFVFQLSADFSHEDTEEICQETFLSVVGNLASFQAKSSFQTWLLRIATNKAMDYRQRAHAAKRGGHSVHLSLDAPSNGEHPPLDPPSARPGPDALLTQAENARLVRQSLDRLSAPCREIIELRYYGDLSYDEIAAELGLHPKTVSSRLSKCLDRLGAIAREYFPASDVFAV